MTDPTRLELALTDDGPMLVEGPVTITMPDGRVVESARPVVALCMCRRSKRFPFCDTSHRPRQRRPIEVTP